MTVMEGTAAAHAWTLTPAEFEATQAKIDRVNERAARRGFTGRFAVAGIRDEVTRNNGIGLAVTEVVYRVTITGEPPQYHGWALLAALDFTDGGVIVRTAPGVESIDRTGLAPGRCDHCKVDRYRTKSFVVFDGRRQLQVGSTCLKDFLGWDGSVVFLSTGDVSGDINDVAGSGDRSYTVDTVLATAWAVIKRNGYVRSTEPGATRDVVLMLLHPQGWRDREAAEQYRPFVRDAARMAGEVRSFILSEAFNGPSEYVTNLKVLCAADAVSARHVGLVASAPQAWARAHERDLIRQHEAAEVTNEWVGAVKERITVRVRVRSVRFLESNWGATTLYTLLSDTGHVFKWFASKDFLGEAPTQDFQRLTGTVKKHEEFDGLRSTVLTRCKVTEEGSECPRGL